jgi:hypothetical protein
LAFLALIFGQAALLTVATHLLRFNQYEKGVYNDVPLLSPIRAAKDVAKTKTGVPQK